jgi:hypothetical protein
MNILLEGITDTDRLQFLADQPGVTHILGPITLESLRSYIDGYMKQTLNKEKDKERSL